MNEEQKATTCKHSTGRVTDTVVYAMPTCRYVHLIRNKFATSRSRCNTCEFYEEEEDESL